MASNGAADEGHRRKKRWVEKTHEEARSKASAAASATLEDLALAVFLGWHLMYVRRRGKASAAASATSVPWTIFGAELCEGR